MPVLSIGEMKYMITLHKIFFFYEILDLEIFPVILGKFRGNLDWDWGWISAPKNTVHVYAQLPRESNNTNIYNDI